MGLHQKSKDMLTNITKKKNRTINKLTILCTKSVEKKPSNSRKTKKVRYSIFPENISRRIKPEMENFLIILEALNFLNNKNKMQAAKPIMRFEIRLLIKNSELLAMKPSPVASIFRKR